MSQASSAQGYAIVDWALTFECSNKGGPWKPGQDFRAGALNYVRVPVVGTFSRRLAMISRIAPEDDLWVVGFFLRDIVGLVAGLDCDRRKDGVLRNLDGLPATAEELAEALGRPPEKVARALSVLLDKRVGLLTVWSPGIPENPGDLPETPGNAGQGPDISPVESGAVQCKAEQKQEQEQEQGQEQPPGNSGGEVAPAGELRWSAACLALRTAFGQNATIDAFTRWLSMEIMRARFSEPESIRRLLDLIQKSRTKDNPGGWFIDATKRPRTEGGFGYCPVPQRGPRDPVTIAEVMSGRVR